MYSLVLTKESWREDVRRSLIDLKLKMGSFISRAGAENGADADLNILLGNPKNKNDPHLLYLMGQCYQLGGGDAAVIEKAVKKYQEVLAIKDAPDRIDAGERLAIVLRDRLNQWKEAKAVINSLVEATPQDDAIKGAPDRINARERLAILVRDRLYLPKEAEAVMNVLAATMPQEHRAYLARAYLARGRFWSSLAAKYQSKTVLTEAEKRALGKDLEKAPKLAKEDFEMARELEPKEPEAYLQLAQAAMSKGKLAYDEARQILSDGLENAPKSAAICRELATVELGSNNLDKAIEIVKRGLEKQPDQGELRSLLTQLLATHGDTGPLLVQIEELKKLGYPAALAEYYTGYYHFNSKNYLKAREILLRLQAAMKRTSLFRFKSTIKVLLAKCYKELGEPEMQRDAYLQALSTDPHDVTAKRGWVNYLMGQGDTDGAIKELRSLEKEVPQVRSMLAELLIGQNQRRPAAQRNWNEVKVLIDKIVQTDPESVDAVLRRAELLFGQGDQGGARDELAKAQVRFPQNIEIRITQAKLLGFEGRVDEALGVLDQAEGKLGDQVELRLMRARLWALKKGPQYLKVLTDLSENVEGFSKDGRKRLLNELAAEFVRQQDAEGASRVWTRLADEDPTDIITRLKLLDLALQNNSKEKIKEDEKNIDTNVKKVEEIEGKEGLLSRYCQIKFLLWQARV